MGSRDDEPFDGAKPMTKSATLGTDQAEILDHVFSLSDFERLAAERLESTAYNFIAGGAADEKTVRWNEAAFDRFKLSPRVLRDVSNIDTQIELLGRLLACPILLAPTGYHRLIHPEGELETARGATLAGAPLVVSSSATMTIEEIAPALGVPFWFQLYLQPDHALNEELVQRAEASGASALCLTVDTPSLGARNREQRIRFALPPGFTTPMNPLTEAKRRAPGDRARSWQRYAMQWSDVERLHDYTKLPVVLKGILHPADAELAVLAGAAAVIVSNHGGRNLDSGLAPIEALPRIAERIAGRVPVLVDGGIRRGTDVIKAVALGASAVLVGRPYLYALGLAGAAGVARVVEILRTELEMAMSLIGCRSLADIDRSSLLAAHGLG
jgi:4-hydroxymandelate oxidase